MKRTAEANNDNHTVIVAKNIIESPEYLTERGAAQAGIRLDSKEVSATARPAPTLWPAIATSHSRNRLLSTATSLLLRLEHFKHWGEQKQTADLFHELTEHLATFQAASASAGIDPAEAEIAHYLLCTVADEAVMTRNTTTEGPWSNASLLSAHHGETDGGVRFFEHLARAERTPANHLDMLELMYMCLSLGFQGKYRLLARGAVEVENIRESLYRQTRSLRGEHTRELSPHWQGLDHRARRTRGNVPGWIVGLFTLVSLAAIYGGFAWVLAEQRHSALEPFLQLDQPAIESRR